MSGHKGGNPGKQIERLSIATLHCETDIDDRNAIETGEAVQKEPTGVVIRAAENHIARFQRVPCAWLSGPGIDGCQRHAKIGLRNCPRVNVGLGSMSINILLSCAMESVEICIFSMVLFEEDRFAHAKTHQQGQHCASRSTPSGNTAPKLSDHCIGLIAEESGLTVQEAEIAAVLRGEGQARSCVKNTRDSRWLFGRVPNPHGNLAVARNQNADQSGCTLDQGGPRKFRLVPIILFGKTGPAIWMGMNDGGNQTIGLGATKQSHEAIGLPRHVALGS